MWHADYFFISYLGLAAAKEAAKLNKNAKVIFSYKKIIIPFVKYSFDVKVACFDFVTPTYHGTKWGLGGK